MSSENIPGHHLSNKCTRKVSLQRNAALKQDLKPSCDFEDHLLKEKKTKCKGSEFEVSLQHLFEYANQEPYLCPPFKQSLGGCFVVQYQPNERNRF